MCWFFKISPTWLISKNIMWLCVSFLLSFGNTAPEAATILKEAFKDKSMGNTSLLVVCLFQKGWSVSGRPPLFWLQICKQKKILNKFIRSRNLKDHCQTVGKTSEVLWLQKSGAWNFAVKMFTWVRRRGQVLKTWQCHICTHAALSIQQFLGKKQNGGYVPLYLLAQLYSMWLFFPTLMM